MASLLRTLHRYLHLSDSYGFKSEVAKPGGGWAVVMEGKARDRNNVSSRVYLVVEMRRHRLQKKAPFGLYRVRIGASLDRKAHLSKVWRVFACVRNDFAFSALDSTEKRAP